MLKILPIIPSNSSQKITDFTVNLIWLIGVAKACECPIISTIMLAKTVTYIILKIMPVHYS